MYCIQLAILGSLINCTVVISKSMFLNAFRIDNKGNNSISAQHLFTFMTIEMWLKIIFNPIC